MNECHKFGCPLPYGHEIKCLKCGRVISKIGLTKDYDIVLEKLNLAIESLEFLKAQRIYKFIKENKYNACTTDGYIEEALEKIKE